MAVDEAPLLLTHVCRRWRDAALSMPVLWQNLHIPLPACPVRPHRIPSAQSTSGSQSAAPSLPPVQTLVNIWGAPPILMGQPVTVAPPALRPEEIHVIHHLQQLYETAISTWKRKMILRIEAVDAWLSRSGNLKLGLNIVEWSPPPDRRTITNGWKIKLAPLKIQLIEVLRKHKHKWQRLELSVTWRFLSEILATEAENLAYLKINHAPMSPPNIAESNQRFIIQRPGAIEDSSDDDELDDLDAENPEEHVTAAQSAAQQMFMKSALLKSSRESLRTLYLKALTTDLFLLPVKWENITELFFEGYSSRFSSWTPLPLIGVHSRFTKQEAALLLAKLTNLRKCHMLVGRADRRRPSVANLLPETKEPIVLQYLEHLSIHETNARQEESLASFFSAFEFPALQSIVFTTTVFPRLSRPSSLLAILASCGPNIRRLAIDYRSFTERDLMQVLSIVSGTVEEVFLTVDYWETREGHWDYDEDHGPHWHGGNDSNSRFFPVFLTNGFLKKLTPRIPRDDDESGSDSGADADAQGEEVEVLCPNLTSFTCRLRTAEFDEAALLRFVHARRHWKVLQAGKIKKMIEKVKIQFAMPKSQRAAEFREEGGRSDHSVFFNQLATVSSSSKKYVHPFVYQSLKHDPMVSLVEASAPPFAYPFSSSRNPRFSAPPLEVELFWPPETRISFFPRGFPDIPGYAAGAVHSTVWSPACGALGTCTLPGNGVSENGGLTESGVRIF
ncbi:hypothetical protein CC1G_01075 [Coprinopsis cinerea okayama7|uniref:F-box domain-containing protein n=1 Tax=Coprinopsis cinerea (strain Okayama-7 / 130 / ATCC MYA-4618 / FGSC 9003) TaxID=240176 RepID=A8NEF6_COPC7|nr:hypothetical protein CC1G_01075 [Coprinopsis cinerea okayama7\|eukprot:XP_001833013.2 hypothetical protein CC1G_01075 [Coprinopsis cinerea okayama7\